MRLYCKQPEGRQGIKGDMAVAWFEKLPKIPFHEAASNAAHGPIKGGRGSLNMKLRDQLSLSV